MQLVIATIYWKLFSSPVFIAKKYQEPGTTTDSLTLSSFLFYLLSYSLYVFYITPWEWNSIKYYIIYLAYWIHSSNFVFSPVIFQSKNMITHILILEINF